VGLATHNPGGQLRFGISATAASAVLYSAVVLFGVSSASPLALDSDSDRGGSVVLIPAHDTAVSGPEQRLPQASPGPVRHHAGPAARAPRVGVGSRSSASRPTSAPVQPSNPASPRTTESQQAKPKPTTTSAPPPPSTALEVTAPTLPELPLPEPTLPTVTVPTLPVQLPETPALPQLPGLDLPG
jgi:hypothetical protein